MQALLDLMPPVAFLVAYYAAGFYVATAVLMAGMALLVVIDLVRTSRVPPLHGASAVLVFAFGAATLVLHDQRFLQWKPTVFFWLLAVAFLVSGRVGAKPLAQRLLESATGAAARVGRERWQRLNLLWVAFYAVLGALNLFVAWNASERTWVNFKVFGLTLATLAFVLPQAVWLSRQAAPQETP